ncbi:MAG: phospholipase domain-containing protein, partial [Polyangiaceae bacterium]
RHYVGNTTSAGANVWIEARYYEAEQHGHHHHGSNGQPKLKLWLHNDTGRVVIFTITHNNYSSRSREPVRVATNHKEAWELDACGNSDGWYDLTVTLSTDSSWSQRLTGHLETGRASISG